MNRFFSSVIALALGAFHLVGAQTQNIAEIAQSNGFNTLLAAVAETPYAAALSDPASDLTVFAPTDAAFAALPDGALDYLLANPDILSDIIAYHVVAGTVLSTSLTNGMMADTLLDGQQLTFSIMNGVAMVDGATIEPADILATNGVVHVIDAVLLPASITLPAGNIAQVAEANGFSTLLAAVAETPYVGALSDPASDLTVFAPTNAAFDALPDGILGWLLANTDVLSDIIAYHVVAGTVLSTSLTDGMMADTLLDGEQLTFSIMNGVAMVNGATIEPADVAAFNGVVHVIDAVLVPDSVALPAGNIAEVAEANGFSTLLAAVAETPYVGALSDPASDLTVFAPTNAAFDALPAGALDFLLANTDVLSDIIAYHVVAGTVYSSALTDGLMSDTLLDGEQLTFSVMEGMFGVNDAMIAPADVPAFNGVVHVIDSVLIPSSISLPLNIVEVAAGDSDTFSTLVAAVTKAELADALTESILTVFAPTNAAFGALPDGALDYLLLDENKAVLQKILLAHVVEGKVMAADLMDGMTVSTLNMVELSVSITGETVMINESTVVVKDVSALNGVIHVIDKVIIPADVEFPDFSATASPSAAPSMAADDSAASIVGSSVVASAMAAAASLMMTLA